MQYPMHEYQRRNMRRPRKLLGRCFVCCPRWTMHVLHRTSNRVLGPQSGVQHLPTRIRWFGLHETVSRDYHERNTHCDVQWSRDVCSRGISSRVCGLHGGFLRCSVRHGWPIQHNCMQRTALSTWAVGAEERRRHGRLLPLPMPRAEVGVLSTRRVLRRCARHWRLCLHHWVHGPRLQRDMRPLFLENWTV